MAAARVGEGVALANLLMADAALRAGTIVEIDFGHQISLGSYYFEARRDRWHNKGIANFRRWLETTIRQAGAVDGLSAPLSQE